MQELEHLRRQHDRHLAEVAEDVERCARRQRKDLDRFDRALARRKEEVLASLLPPPPPKPSIFFKIFCFFF
jgi:hypothetical protein